LQKKFSENFFNFSQLNQIENHQVIPIEKFTEALAKPFESLFSKEKDGQKSPVSAFDQVFTLAQFSKEQKMQNKIFSATHD
jgi:hypothetical protein